MGRKVSQATHVATSLWQNPRWYHAMTLTERLASQQAGMNDQPFHDSGDREKAERRLQQWKRQSPFDQGSFFADRLAMDSITENDLLALLAEPIEAVQTRMSLSTPPDWLVELNLALEDPDGFTDISLPIKQAKDHSDPMVFLHPIKPLLRQGLKGLEVGIQDLIQQHAELPFDPQTIASILFANLPGQILPKLSRTLVLELNVARLQASLQGDTSEERFQSYLQLLGQPLEVLSLLEEYCVLARQLITTIERWVNFSLEFVRHLCADWQDICMLFTPESDPGALTEVIGGAGDTHRGGRSVMILKFRSGFQLVYKPKSLAVDAHFQELLTWLNERGQYPAFRTFKVIDRGKYGWSEFIHASECQSEEGVERFYERQGGYLALLYAFEATDFHYENVIAAGEHPMPVDLEALFHPHALHDLILPEHPAHKVMNHSVLQIGLLPMRLWGNDEAEGIDVSGLGGQEGQLSPYAVSRWEEAGTDQMRLVRERVEIDSKKNRPRLNGHDVETIDYCEYIVRGFTTTYRLLVEHREEFLKERLPCFAHDDVRRLARATKVYALLLSESFHPNMLRDALKRDRFFDRLWLAVKDQPHLSRLIAAERADLLQGEIPMFTTRPGSRDLFTSQGERISEFFAEPCLERVRERLQHLNEEDLVRQTWMIRASFTSMSMDTAGETRKRFLLKPAHTIAARERLVTAARAAGERLSDLALLSEDAAGWLGVALVNEREWSLQPADSSLYSGTPGIALFLGYLGHITGETKYTALARSALKTIRYEIAQLKKHSRFVEIGAFIGLGAPIYLLSHLGVLWNEPALFQEARELVKLLPELIEKDDKLDILAGSAGCIASLLCLHAVAPSAPTLAVAIQCGDHLLASAQQMKVGVGWNTLQEEIPLTGFSHGTAGIAWSLLKLANASGEERFRHTALAALAYERSLFSASEQNWPDLRSRLVPNTAHRGQAVTEEHDHWMMAWCHGAPGIGLGRLGSLPYLDDAVIREEINIALTTTLAHGFGRNHSLCHGDFGNLETLLLATQTFEDPQYREQLERIGATLLDSIDTYGWITGVPLGLETPDLMTGLAGIGYELLRLAEPEKVPSVLLLEPPFCKGEKGSVEKSVNGGSGPPR